MPKFMVVIYEETKKEVYDSLEEAEEVAEYQNRVQNKKTDIVMIEDDDEWFYVSFVLGNALKKKNLKKQ